MSIVVITLLGDNPQIITIGDPYIEMGATSTVDGSIAIVSIDASSVNTSVLGTYSVVYTAPSSNSDTQEIRTVNVVLPDAPKKFAISDVQCSDIELTWIDDIPNLFSYQINYDTNPDFSNFSNIINIHPPYRVTGLESDTTYYFRIRGVITGIVNFTEWSETISVRTPLCPNEIIHIVSYWNNILKRVSC